MLEELLTNILLGVSAAGLFYLIKELIEKRSELRRETRRLTHTLDVSREQTRQIVEDYLADEDKRDARMAFVKLAIESERALRQIAETYEIPAERLRAMKTIDQLLQRGIIDEDFYYAFKSLWKIRNQVVHGYSVTDDEVEAGLFLGASLILKLEQVRRRGN